MAQACFQCERVDFARIVEREILVFGIVLADEHGGSQQLPDLMVAEEFAATVQQRFVLRVGRVQRTFDQRGLRDRRGRHVEIHGHEIYGG